MSGTHCGDLACLLSSWAGSGVDADAAAVAVSAHAVDPAFAATASDAVS